MVDTKRKREQEDPPIEDENIFRSAPIEDRSSTFIGYFSPTLSGKQLQSISEIKSASHKILAWRKESAQRSLVDGAIHEVGHDDDGEKYGGKRVEKVLEQMRVVGTCVVARWYGGTLLGPVRFTHIETCAKEAVRAWQNHLAEESNKKQKLQDEALEKAELVETLAERDRSVDVLRKLAAEKEQKVKKGLLAGMRALEGTTPPPDADATIENAGPNNVAVISPTKPSLDYSTLPVERLRALSKARDATLSFLLKRIDKADDDLRALNVAGAIEKPP